MAPVPYTILKAGDWALLSGTSLLFVAPADTMYFTKKVHEPRG